MPRMDGSRPAYGTEAICVAHAPREAGRTRWNGGGKPAVYPFPVQEPCREHPTQKPLALMEALIRDFTDPGDLVVDPFAGAGTTLVAARRLGRRALGWERSPAYFSIAERRIRDAREQLTIPLARQPKPKQSALVLAPAAPSSESAPVQSPSPSAALSAGRGSDGRSAP